MSLWVIAIAALFISAPVFWFALRYYRNTRGHQLSDGTLKPHGKYRFAVICQPEKRMIVERTLFELRDALQSAGSTAALIQVKDSLSVDPDKYDGIIFAVKNTYGPFKNPVRKRIEKMNLEGHVTALVYVDQSYSGACQRLQKWKQVLDGSDVAAGLAVGLRDSREVRRNRIHSFCRSLTECCSYRNQSVRVRRTRPFVRDERKAGQPAVSARVSPASATVSTGISASVHAAR